MKQVHDIMFDKTTNYDLQKKPHNSFWFLKKKQEKIADGQYRWALSIKINNVALIPVIYTVSHIHGTYEPHLTARILFFGPSLGIHGS